MITSEIIDLMAEVVPDGFWEWADANNVHPAIALVTLLKLAKEHHKEVQEEVAV